MSDVDSIWRVRSRTPAHKVYRVRPEGYGEEEFYREFERPEVLPYIVGFAGISPCKKHGFDIPDKPPGGDDEYLVDGGDIGRPDSKDEDDSYAVDGGDI